jgi:hypothetical protein
MRRRIPILLGLVCLVAVSAAAQIRKADFVALAGDSDDAIRLAKIIKEIFTLEPAARRAVTQGRDAVIQSWLEERPLSQLTDQERAVVLNPDLYDNPVLQDVTVALNASPPAIVLGWDVPPRLWPRLAASMAPVANRVVRDGAMFARKGLRLSLKLQGVEMYRANADVDGNVTVVFMYE